MKWDQGLGLIIGIRVNDWGSGLRTGIVIGDRDKGLRLRIEDQDWIFGIGD